MSTEVIVCYSRCVYCGRRTPHEACHEHHSKVGGKFPAVISEVCPTCGQPPEDAAWVDGSSKELETCTDPNCPAWEPGEYNRVMLGIMPPWRWSARLEFKREDCWIGAYWQMRGQRVDIWICLLPMLPIHIMRRRADD